MVRIVVVGAKNEKRNVVSISLHALNRFVAAAVRPRASLTWCCLIVVVVRVLVLVRGGGAAVDSFVDSIVVVRAAAVLLSIEIEI